MKIKRIEILSTLNEEGLDFNCKTETEQHLIISHNGNVWFQSYNKFYSKDILKLIRRQNFTLDTLATKEIFNLFSSFLDNVISKSSIQSSINTWQIKIYESNGTVYVYKGVMTGGICVSNINLSSFLKKYIAIDNLLLFDKPDCRNVIQ